MGIVHACSSPDWDSPSALLQEWQATTVVPITFALQSFLPIVVEPLFLRESWGSLPLAGAPLAAGLALAVRRRAC